MENKLIYKGIIFITSIMITVGCKKQQSEENIDTPIKSVYGALNPNAPKETMQFGQLVGKWDVISFDSIPNEGWHESKALWTYKYSLDGYAIEDIWYEKFSDSTSNTMNVERDFTGKNIRVFDPNTKQWNITWIENGNNTMMAIITAKANEKGDIIMLSPNNSAEITFYNITKDSFDWKFELLIKDKKILYSRMSASRLE